MSVTPLAVAEVTQRGRRKPTALTLDLAGVRAAIAELQRAEQALLAAQAAADAPAEASPAEPEAPAAADGAGDSAPGQPDSGAGESATAAGPAGQDPPGPAARVAGRLPRRDGGRIRQAEMLDGAGGRQLLVWGDPRIDEVLAAGGTLVRTFDVLDAGGAAREWTAPRSHPELFLVPDRKAAVAAAAS